MMEQYRWRRKRAVSPIRLPKHTAPQQLDISLDASDTMAGRKLEKLMAMSIEALAHDVCCSDGTKQLRITIDVLERTAVRGFNAKQTRLKCHLKHS